MIDLANLHKSPFLRYSEEPVWVMTDNEEDPLHVVLFVYDDGAAYEGSYHDPKEWQITPTDIDGGCLVKVPADHIKGFYTNAEAECIMRCMEADQRLLSYAR